LGLSEKLEPKCSGFENHIPNEQSQFACANFSETHT
jgi:hypothetical protein